MSVLSVTREEFRLLRDFINEQCGILLPNVYSKYFIRKDLSIKEVENITSAFFNGKLKLIPMTGEESTYDYDGTDFEYRMINKMLQTENQ